MEGQEEGRTGVREEDGRERGRTGGKEAGMAREVGMEEESEKGREREGRMREREGGKRELWSIDILSRQDQEPTKSLSSSFSLCQG